MKKEITRFLYGGDYNPDQWPEDVWQNDIALMKALKVNTVTLPVFSWANLQPSEDTFNFGWLDRVMDLLLANQINVIMATPTAAQPAWMSRKYPDMLPVDVQGHRHKHGARTNFCVNNPSYRRFSAQIAAKMAERYKDYPNLILWHINNEYGTYCYCDHCAQKFQEWLQERYGSIENLNQAWYTNFWGHTLYDWQDVVPPSHVSSLLPGALGNRDGAANQSVAIDYNRFMSDSFLACMENEITQIRKYTPDIPVTTNLMGAFKPIDYFRLSQDLDYVSWDNYPSIHDPASLIAFKHDLTRGLAKGKPFLLMEQTPNQQNWQPYNTLKRPGVMRLWSYQAIAHGANSVLFFQWRQSLGACEKYHAAMVPHAGHLNTRIGRELKALGDELSRLDVELLQATNQARAAILFDWSNWWAAEYSSGPTRDIDYVGTVHQYYRAVYKRNIPVDVVSTQADLSEYDIVLAPLLYMTSDDLTARIKQFVANGGSFITTYFSGIVNENDLVIPGGYPGAFRDLLGIWVEETDALSPEMKNSVVPVADQDLFSGRYDCGIICDVIHAEGAKVLATFGQDFYAGRPAVTENQYGQGKAYYIATAPEDALLDDLVQAVCQSHQLGPLFDVPAGVEVTRRYAAGTVFTFVLNHNSTEVKYTLPEGEHTDVLRNAPISGDGILPGRDLLIFR